MKSLSLQNGDQMPALGLGTWKSENAIVGNAVYTAIEMGYRHIDCASIYGNEAEIGEALARCFNDGLVKREDLWITSKLWNDSHAPDQVKGALVQTLSDLGLDYLDLYLIHWPVAIKKDAGKPPSGHDFIPLSEIPLATTWAAMEELVDAGLSKHIGVSNFSISNLQGIMEIARHPVACNQVELHPYLQQDKLVDFCKKNKILVTAYAPLGSFDRSDKLKRKDEPVLLEDPLIQEIASQYKSSPAQILLAWSLKRQTSVIPKSVNPARMKENLDAHKITLEQEEMDRITKINLNRRYFNGKFWAPKGSPYTIESLWG